MLKKEYKKITSAEELGSLIRKNRKKSGFTIESVSGLTTLGKRFISEIERGKKSASLAKVIVLVNITGLKLFVFPKNSTALLSPYGQIKAAADIGKIARYHRKNQSSTLSYITDISEFNTRFLSDLENGRDNIQLEKVICALNLYGLELLVKGVIN